MQVRSTVWPYTVLLTCIAYVCLVTTSALGVGLSLRPWNISCFNAHASSLIMLPALRPGHHNTRPAHPVGGLRHTYVD
ncbi:hypothetical protein E2C01_049196 [Portunus trituberculatus]|uniref:Uncharacterized protein n=1 Tax=Portunus trituberculatus TaxID=210409 RepID=A0A5B7GFE6_PORTR|nr:hypothetical protein [Portunus trituberculatus]